MTHAYNELYLNDAKECLADMLDYAINDCNFKSDWIASLFVTTGYAQNFETGNPAIISGMSGIELARMIIKKPIKTKNSLLSNTVKELRLSTGRGERSLNISGYQDTVLRISLNVFLYPKLSLCIPFITKWI